MTSVVTPLCFGCDKTCGFFILIDSLRPPKPVVFHAGQAEYMTCALDLTPTYAVISSCISFYIPCVVMIGIYCRLYCYAQKHVQSIRAVTRPLTNSAATATTATAAATAMATTTTAMTTTTMKNTAAATLTAVHHHTSPYHVSDHKAAITVGVIMGTFLLCWVPFFCVNIIAAFCKTCIPEAAFKVSPARDFEQTNGKRGARPRFLPGTPSPLWRSRNSEQTHKSIIVPHNIVP